LKTDNKIRTTFVENAEFYSCKNHTNDALRGVVGVAGNRETNRNGETKRLIRL